LSVVVVALVLVGVSYSIATASIWPLVPFMLPPSQLATGYGTMTAIENLGLAIMSLVIPSAVDAGSVIALVVLMSSAIIAAIFTAVQIFIDRKYNAGTLNRRASERQLAVD